MRKLIATITTTAALTVGLTFAAASPAGAHDGGPCGNPGPGNSGYATHHIVVNATAGTLGNNGHKPGSHQGYSVCL